ncbi:extracellular solute-binding protein [Nesterenkonia sp. PF2B19]|uniref:extracellular solute-binding protein n=1 Tax=unclassified Nesterenkonia TaxID=2629769 RepID=UPI000A19C89B|nr:extracellular solute-binding protein [Nesterenkonia sp. PF2B19]OSM42584.1 sugar ABC transporter substrate-binding protein [Nesterenkonia sp. PF2B19]
MRARTVMAAVLGTSVVAVSACGGGDAEGDGETAGSLDVWIMQGTNPDAESFFEEVSEAFEEETGAELNVEFVQWADAHDRFVTSIAGGTTPDVAETGTTWTAEFADAGALAPLDDYVADAGLADDLVEGLVEAGTYEDSLHGMPWYAGVRSILYRADIFEELDLEAPTTWEEVVEVAEAVQVEHPEMNAFGVPGNAEMTVYPWIWGAGGEVATLEGEEWTSHMDSPESIEGIEFLTGLQTEHGFSSEGATTWTEVDLLDSFVAGETVMGVMGSWTPATILEQEPDLEGAIAAAPIPGRDGGIADSVLGGSHLSMFETAEDKDLAWTFIEMMTTGEFAEQWGEASGYFPGQVSLLDAVMESEDELVAPFATQFVEGGGTLPVTPRFGAVQAQETTNAAIQSILAGNADAAEAMEAAAEEMTDLLNQE